MLNNGTFDRRNRKARRTISGQAGNQAKQEEAPKGKNKQEKVNFLLLPG